MFDVFSTLPPFLFYSLIGIVNMCLVHILYETIAMMCGESPPSENVLEKMMSKNSSGFKEDLKMEICFFFLKITMSYLFTYYFNKYDKTQQTKSLFSVRLKFAVFNHHCNFKTLFHNEMYRSFGTIHSIIIRF